MRALVCVYIIEEVAHVHAQKAPLEWFSSTLGLGVVLSLLTRSAVAYPVIDIHDNSYKIISSNSPCWN